MVLVAIPNLPIAAARGARFGDSIRRSLHRLAGRLASIPRRGRSIREHRGHIRPWSHDCTARSPAAASDCRVARAGSCRLRPLARTNRRPSRRRVAHIWQGEHRSFSPEHASQFKYAPRLFVTPSWLKSAEVNARMRGRRGLRNHGRRLQKRAKNLIRRKKFESEILVNGYKVARINQEA
jgi:hypothetical protein